MDEGGLYAYCYMVKRGKPAACIPVHVRDINKARQIASQELCLSYSESLANDWFTFWVYQYPHILDVIKSLPQVPRTAYDHWLLGKLFGYEEAAIHEYIKSTLS